MISFIQSLLRRSMPSHLIVTRVMKILLYYTRFNQVALRSKSLRSTTVKASDNTENTYATVRSPSLSTPKSILMRGPKSFMLVNSLLELHLIPSCIMNANKLGNYYGMNTRRSCMTSFKSQLHGRLP